MVYKLERRPNKKQQLFSTAAKLVAEQGFEALTIDALARAANLTKGGVQYHFASKDQLIAELLEYLLKTFDEALDQIEGSWLSAYVELMLGEEMEGDGAVAAILASLPPGDPRGAAFEHYASKWRIQASSSGLDPALGQVIRLAADAQWLERAFGGATVEDSAAILKQLRKLIAENTK
jgi:AcrR family transcriptional regulator